jgi:hypothetical protein
MVLSMWWLWLKECRLGEKELGCKLLFLSLFKLLCGTITTGALKASLVVRLVGVMGHLT